MQYKYRIYRKQPCIHTTTAQFSAVFRGTNTLSYSHTRTRPCACLRVYNTRESPGPLFGFTLPVVSISTAVSDLVTIVICKCMIEMWGFSVLNTRLLVFTGNATKCHDFTSTLIITCQSHYLVSLALH